MASLPLRDLSRPQCLYLEFRLDWLLQLADLGRAPTYRRLNAIQNLLTDLAGDWRKRRGPLNPLAEVQMSARTYHDLVTWIELRAPAVGVDQKRLSEYAPRVKARERMLDGWVRLLVQDEPVSTH
jgi:hypothetical protein